MVIVQPLGGSVKEYVEAFLSQGCPFPLPDRCPHPNCQAHGSLIRWGTYERWALTGEVDYRLRIQRVRCKVCGRTHSLLPGFLHPHRQFVISLLQQVVALYLLTGLGWRQVMRWLRKAHRRGPARSTVREWVASFAYGAGYLLLAALLRHLLALDPGVDMPDSLPGHVAPLACPLRPPHRSADRLRNLQNAHTFWLLAEQLYAQVKQRQHDLRFSATQTFPFLLHWLQGQRLPPRLFWSSLLATTPTHSF